jgi:hypothetical protein
MYKNMATLYHFTPQQVSEMTFAQLDAYLGEKKTYTADQIEQYTERRNHGG